MEKATELGVKKVYPLLTDNCALSKDVIEKKIPKWQKIMFEASKQCERAKIPECMPAITLEELPKVDKIIVFCEKHTDLSLKKYLSENLIKKGEKILVVIGAEGGFSAREFDFFKKQGMIMVTLGDLILKAETAVIVSVGNLIYEFKNN
jgi:16S rRNA (uracil1498-N3)-methyltransferase